jgi:hypothetical protein
MDALEKERISINSLKNKISESQSMALFVLAYSQF